MCNNGYYQNGNDCINLDTFCKENECGLSVTLTQKNYTNTNDTNTGAFIGVCEAAGGVPFAGNTVCRLAMTESDCSSISATYNSNSKTCECTNGMEWNSSANICTYTTLTQDTLLEKMSEYCASGIEKNGTSCVVCTNNNYTNTTEWVSACNAISGAKSSMPSCCIEE